MLRIIFLLLCMVLSACARAPVSTPTSEPVGTPTQLPIADCSSPSNWTIQYHRTGGIAGFDQMLTLQSDGSLMVQSKKPALEKQITVPENHLESVQALLVQACPFEAARSTGVCADCYNYELNIQMDGQEYILEASDTTLTQDQRPLIEVLDQFLQLTGQ